MIQLLRAFSKSKTNELQDKTNEVTDDMNYEVMDAPQFYE